MKSLTHNIVAQAAAQADAVKTPVPSADISADAMIDILIGGGIMMVPLFLLAIYLFYSGLKLLFYVWGEKLADHNTEEWRNWVTNPANAKGAIGNIIQYTQDHVRTAKDVHNRFSEVREAVLGVVDRNLVMLDTLVGAAPLLGLLGTVMGMLTTFDGLAMGGGAETSDVVAGGIKEALLTTMTGLTIALPGLFLAMLIRTKKHAIEAGISELQSITLSHLKLD